MGYELVVLDESGRERLDAVELSPDEHAGIERIARDQRMPVLSSFPGYWDVERQVAVGELRALLGELDQAAGLASTAPQAQSAIKKLQRVVDSALRNGRPLEVVPD